MKVKILANSRFRVLAVMSGDECPAEDFILNGPANTKSVRAGLAKMLDVVAQRGLGELPHGWCHEADKERGIFEFRKGRLRLFFFKGRGNEIAVCASGVLKKQSKADQASVAWADKCKKEYLAACAANVLEVVEDDS